MGKKKTKGELWGGLKASWKCYRSGVSKGNIMLQEKGIEGIRENAEALELKANVPKVVKK